MGDSDKAFLKSVSLFSGLDDRQLTELGIRLAGPSAAAPTAPPPTGES